MAVVKFKPEDFKVSEVYIPQIDKPTDQRHDYYYLRKRGYTTFEAIERLATTLDCARHDISYAGLKDEDGITEQLVGVAQGCAHGPVDLNKPGEGIENWIKLSKSNLSGPPIEIGQLVGNAFRVVIRNLDPALSERIEAHRKHEFHFLNYYDTQRFGIPNAPKNTHLVGQQLIVQDFEAAFDVLLSSQTNEAKKAEAWTGDKQGFFETLDPRVCSFYYAAAASFDWNQTLINAIDQTDTPRKREEFRNGLRYLFSNDPNAIFNAQEAARKNPMVRYGREGDFAPVGTEERPAVIQTRFRLVDIGPDEHHQGQLKAAFEYFLPSGCYATMAMEQFAHHLKNV